MYEKHLERPTRESITFLLAMVHAQNVVEPSERDARERSMGSLFTTAQRFKAANLAHLEVKKIPLTCESVEAALTVLLVEFSAATQ